MEGKPNLETCTEIELAKLGQRFRTQKIVFETAVEIFDQMKPGWKGSREFLWAQVIGLVGKFITSQRIEIQPALFERDDLRRRIILTLNMRKLVHHIWKAIRFENTETVLPVFDTERPIRGTADMRPWYTGRPCEPAKRFHINLCVYDSTWEASEAFILDRDKHVAAWVKNDHLGFEILYTFEGALHKFRPDFIIRLTNGKFLVLEIKAQDSRQNRAKREFLDEWVRAVNEHGEFGRWCSDVSWIPADVRDILAKHGG